MRAFYVMMILALAMGCGDSVSKDKGGSTPANNSVAEGCGDGVVDGAETCDPGIASGEGACPESCAAPACSSARLVGSASACTAECIVEPIACMNGDGCCPVGCDSSTDTDCTNMCGNGTVEAPEVCDGNCPTTCDDGNTCTTDTLTGDAASCSAECTNTVIAACINGDGCCPAGCSAMDDNDCGGSMCGNGAVDPGETCDGDCPTTCDDGNACTLDQLSGSPAQCNVSCTTTRIDVCQTGDGCCPPGCTFAQDNDCNCTPTTCQAVGATCGLVDDGCGATLDCGTCANGTCVDNTCDVMTDGEVGDACVVNEDCAPAGPTGQALCDMTLATTSFCTVPCLPPILGCPMGSVCELQPSGMAGYCFATCQNNNDCINGFSCLPATGGGTACLPAP